LTPQGRGAIAVIRLWGSGALELVDEVFRPLRKVKLSGSPRRRLRLGQLGSGLGDEVIAVVLDGDPPEVEVHCHGGPAALDLVINALIAAGAERRQPVAWVRHAARTLVEAESLVDIARTTTARTAEILLEQSQGAWESEIRQLIEDVQAAPTRAPQTIEELLKRSEVGLRLISGWRVVLAGRPNVGKSCLLNALAGYSRAIVAPTPGTTRDVVTIRTAFDGWPVELADTAGIRAAGDAIESQGVSLAEARQGEADLVLVVWDGSEPLTPMDEALRDRYRNALVVVNKVDLTAAWPRSEPALLPTSAARGDGIEELGQAIARRLVPEPPKPGSAVPSRPWHVRRLRETASQLGQGDIATALASLRSLLDRPK
jgi:tRNA modification GTPase